MGNAKTEQNPFGSGKESIKVKFIQYAETEEEKTNAIYDMDVWHQTFLEVGDFTEYKAAIALVGDWITWEKYKAQWPTLRRNIQAWKDELEVKLQSDAMTKLVTLVHSKSEQTAANVCKFMVQSGYSQRASAGRPSNEEKRKEAARIARAASDTEEEEGRVLQLLTGGKVVEGNG
jgi:hypothetical protein